MGDAGYGFLIRENMGNSYDLYVSEETHGKEHEEFPIRHGDILDIIVVVRFYKVNILIYYDYENTKGESKSDWYFYSPKSENEVKFGFNFS